MPYGLVTANDLIGSVTQNVTGAANGITVATLGTSAGVSTSGTGTSATISITVVGGVVAAAVVGVGDSGGSGFQVGDTITVTNAFLAGASQNLIITLTANDILTNTSQGSTQFELHPTEQTNLILQILMYSGVVIRDPQIVQTAANMVQQDEVLEKS